MGDEWGSVIFKLIGKGVDPTRFGDLTYPLMIEILSDGQAGSRRRELMRSKKLLADVKTGRLGWRE